MGLGIQRKKCNAGEIELLLAGTQFGVPFLSYNPYPVSLTHPRTPTPGPCLLKCKLAKFILISGPP